jgi:hypothetical protein
MAIQKGIFLNVCEAKKKRGKLKKKAVSAG